MLAGKSEAKAVELSCYCDHGLTVGAVQLPRPHHVNGLDASKHLLRTPAWGW
jgi:hypothetical protein